MNASNFKINIPPVEDEPTVNQVVHTCHSTNPLIVSVFAYVLLSRADLGNPIPFPFCLQTASFCCGNIATADCLLDRRARIRAVTEDLHAGETTTRQQTRGQRVQG
jgi:hypothetical protein